MSYDELSIWLPLDPLARLTVAVIASAFVGWEREYHDKPAGLRTHMMVALGSATFVLVGMQVVGGIDSESVIRIDPTRVIAGIVGGIGFLGAGTIIHSRGAVEGITTAASVWVAAGIGIAAGLAMYGIVFSVVFLSLVILGVLRVIQARFVEKAD